jgi:CRISPR-associated endonuclease/helicase Cas3
MADLVKSDVEADFTRVIARHCVPSDDGRMSPLQRRILDEPAPVRIFSAPTGAGKSYAFVCAAAAKKRVLFVVPTRRLAQNLAIAAMEQLPAASPGAPSRVALWSSDETARLRAEEPDILVARHRIRQVRQFGNDVDFLVATPESVAFMLLHALRSGAGANPFNIADLVNRFDHIVFDEFHTIDARGFGLCAALTLACASADSRARVTFLSATPIDIAPVLVTFGVNPASIATGAEEVTTTDAPSGPHLRALHGDVRLSFVTGADLLTLLELHAVEIRDCLASDRQVVVILDRLEELLTVKQDVAVLFQRLGVGPEARMAINSVDDSVQNLSLPGLFVTDRTKDPTGYRVLLATSSVEMGVTFKAGLIIMDPGHDALSFVQRLGRVARGDEQGAVIVRVDPARLSRAPWLREILIALQATSAREKLSIDQFLELVLKATRVRFKPGPGELAADTPDMVFRSMPQRAVWAAAVFWYALEEAQYGRGFIEALRALRPAKVGLIAARLYTIRQPTANQEQFGERWARAFLAQAATLRDISATLTVTDSTGSTRTLPMRLVENHALLSVMPVTANEKGQWTLWLDCPFDAVDLTDKTGRPISRRQDILLPNGESMQVDANKVADEAVRAIQRLKRKPGTSQRMETRLDAAMDLVRLSGLVPGSQDLLPVATTAIL